MPLREADGIVTATELEYRVADLERLLAMMAKARTDKDKACKDKNAEEDAVADLDLVAGKQNQKQMVEIKHKPAPLM